jgi:hypothetical protein
MYVWSCCAHSQCCLNELSNLKHGSKLARASYPWRFMYFPSKEILYELWTILQWCDGLNGMSRKDGVLVCHCLSANSSHWQQHHYSNCCRLEHEGHTPPKKPSQLSAAQCSTWLSELQFYKFYATKWWSLWNLQNQYRRAFIARPSLGVFRALSAHKTNLQ